MTISKLFHQELPPLRAGHGADAELIARRAGISAVIDPSSVVDIGGLACVATGPDDAETCVIHFHGGGYRLGSPAAWAPFALTLAEQIKAKVILPGYRLAPEYPFPAALHDAVRTLTTLLAEPGIRVILSGDSAGGGLALAAASMLRPPTPLAGLILFSPWLDLTLSGSSYDRCEATDVLFSRKLASEAAKTYLQGHEPRDPLASPLFGALSGLPPTMIMASSHEVVIDDSVALMSKLTASGIRTTLMVEPMVPHVWPIIDPHCAATMRAFDQIALFVDTIRQTGSVGSNDA